MIILNDCRMMSEQETGKDNIILIPITNSLNEIFNKQW